MVFEEGGDGALQVEDVQLGLVQDLVHLVQFLPDPRLVALEHLLREVRVPLVNVYRRGVEVLQKQVALRDLSFFYLYAEVFDEEHVLLLDLLEHFVHLFELVGDSALLLRGLDLRVLVQVGYLLQHSFGHYLAS